MEIVEKNIDEIVPYNRNPRKNEDAVQYVKASLQEFGWKQPIVVDINNVIVVGHTRWLAAKELGLEKAPCLIASDLTDEQIKAYRLADNKTAEFASWDFELMDSEIADIIDIDMTNFGFVDIDDADMNDYEQNIKINDKFQIIKDCENEDEAENIYNKIMEQGIQCRISTL